MEMILVPFLLLLGLGFAGVLETDDATDPDTDKITPDPDIEPNEQDFGSANDTVKGTGDADIYRLGKGDDAARMGAGDDVAFGEAGDDQVTGGGGDDRISLGDGNDQNFLTNANGNDLNADNFVGNDVVRGGLGDDRIADFVGENRLFGGRGSDLLDGIDQSGSATTGDDLFGGNGSDRLFGDSGDMLSGGSGVDSFSLIYDEGTDEPAVITDYEAGERLFISVPMLFDAGDAILEQDGDNLNLRIGDKTMLVIKGVSDPADVDLTITASDFADHTTNPDDLVYGTENDDVLRTGNGDDAIFTGRGDDVVDAGDGDDYVSLRTARPFELEGELGWGNNNVDAGAGRDQVIGGMGDDVIDGANGNDLIVGGGGQDQLIGGSGDDRIDGFDDDEGEADIIEGGKGADVISADDGDTVTGGKGRDTIIIEEFVNGDDVVVLTDFDPKMDQLEVAVNGGNLNVTFEPKGDATRVLVGGKAVFELHDTTPRDMRDADIRVSTYF